MKKETFLAIIIAIIALFFSNLPFLAGVLEQKKDMVYLGRHFMNSQDTYTYIAFIEQAKQGRTLFENLYTSEPQQPRLLRLSFLVMGKTAALFSMSSIQTYHLFRLLFNVIFFIVLYIFISKYFTKTFDRLLAYSVVLLSSGIGSFIALFFHDWTSTDLNIPESITTLSLSEAPHFILSQTLMLTGFLLFLKGIRTKRMEFFTLSGLSFFFLSLEHPFNIPVVFAVLFALTFFAKADKGAYKGLFLTGFVTTIGFGYQAFEFFTNPIARAWSAQNTLLSPEPYYYLTGYGFLIPLAIFGMEKHLQNLSRRWFLLIAWVTITMILLYAPVSVERRFSEGLHIPLALYATEGMLAVGLYVKKFFKPLLAKTVFYYTLGFLMALLLPSNIMWIAYEIQHVRSDKESSYYYHLPTSETEAISFLKATTSTSDVVLSNLFYGNLIPGITARKVFIGHNVQTISLDEKIQEVNSFLLEKDNRKAYEFLKKNSITYIFLGKNDAMIQYGFKPLEKPYLAPVYRKGDVLVLKVR